MSELFYIILASQPSLLYWLTTIIIFILIIILAYFYLEWKTWSLFKEEKYLEKIIQKRTEEITKEKEEIEHLLVRLLPKETADELKSTGRVRSKKYEMVTVLFSDIQGFTKIAKEIDSEDLIEKLDTIFYNFDLIVDKHNIEKIKTIGDSYMCAGGLPMKNHTNPVETILVALEMQQYMRELNLKSMEEWKTRIGVHTGSVIAGVIGRKRLSFDIWGDTVNTASRMESTGSPGQINISGYTYELVKDFYTFEYRGKFPVKDLGAVDMYFVTGIRVNLSIKIFNTPNQNFYSKLQLIRLKDLETEIIKLYKNRANPSLYHNNLKLVMDVYKQIDILIRNEGILDEEALILKTSALLFDLPFIIDSNGNEKKQLEFTVELLSRFKYNRDQIKEITQLMKLRNYLITPKSNLEKTLADALTFFYGKANFKDYLDKIYFQQKELQGIESDKKWFSEQIKYFENHQFYTRYAQENLSQGDKEKQSIIADIRFLKDLVPTEE